jgi:tetratricopeptide (TPR) repeat protein
MKPFPVAVRERTGRVLKIAGLLALIAPVSAWGGIEIYVEAELREARARLAHYDFSAAQWHLHNCLAHRPGRFDIRFLAAQTARRAGDYHDALEELEHCQKLAGASDNVTLLEKTLLRAQQGEIAAVEKILWVLVEDDHPEKLMILEALARGYIVIYCLPLAEKCLKMLLEARPDHAEAWLWRAGIFDMSGNRTDALDYYLKALALRPENDAYRLRLALFLLQANKVVEAYPHLQQLYKNHADNPDVLVGLARYLSSRNEPDKARQMLDRALALEPDHVQGLAELARLDLLEGRASRAEASLRKALALEPSDRAINFLLYQCLERTSRREEARRQLDAMHALERDLKRVEQIMRDDLTKDRNDPKLYHELGTIFKRHGRPDRARFWFSYALSIDPGHQPSRQALAAFASASRESR